MKTIVTLIVLGMLAAMVGCDVETTVSHDNSKTNAWLVRSYSDDAIKNAIIVQHTLYPYHFVSGSAELNALGEHDLAILAGHFKKYAGTLNVRRGPETAELYAARLKAAIEGLQLAGIDENSISISDGMPGGEGMSSERVVDILNPDPASTPQQTRVVKTTY